MSELIQSSESYSELRESNLLVSCTLYKKQLHPTHSQLTITTHNSQKSQSSVKHNYVVGYASNPLNIDDSFE
jgi:hypothetical protein